MGIFPDVKAESTIDAADKFLNFYSLFGGFRKEENQKFQNWTLQEIADARKQDPYEALFDLLVEEGGKLFMVGGVFDNPIGDDYMRELFEDPHCSFMSDIVGADFDHGNPVAHGAFTKVLQVFAREKGFFSMEEAVRKMTSLPAGQMGLKDRGEIRKNAFADITIFNPDTVKNNASYADPYQLSEGIETVMVNERVVLNNGEYDTTALAGTVLRRS